ncbi:MAG: diacylglycerol kinase family lipid kinase [bacterium]
MSDVFVLFNPAAGRGRGARRIPRFRELLDRAMPGRWTEATTSRAGEEASLVDAALDRGYDTIVAVGGDGTWSAVADRIARRAEPRPKLALLPGGTGNDFGKSLGIVWDRAEEIVASIATGRTRRVDVGRVGERTFLNVVGMGFDIAVIDDSYRVPILKGDALYKFCALRQLFSFPGQRFRVRGENGDGDVEPVAHLMLVVANGRYFGGSFDIAPDADLADGAIDVVSIRDARPLTRAKLFGLVAKGQHVGHERVTIRHGARFEIDFQGPLRYEVDGEVFETSGSRLVIESVPGALEIVVP